MLSLLATISLAAPTTVSAEVAAPPKERRPWTANSGEDATALSLGMSPAEMRGMHMQPSVKVSIVGDHRYTELQAAAPIDGGGATFSLGVGWRVGGERSKIGFALGLRGESDTDAWTPSPGESNLYLGVSVPVAIWVHPARQLSLELGGSWRATLIGEPGGSRPVARAGAELLLWHPLFLSGSVQYQLGDPLKEQSTWAQSIDLGGWNTGSWAYEAQIGLRL